MWSITRTLACVCLLLLPHSKIAWGEENDAGVFIPSLKRIYILADAQPAERTTAKMLQSKLKELYGARLIIHTSRPGKSNAGIVVGRQLAVETGLLETEELEAVKYDGYVIKGSGNQVVLAGYGPQGTIYAGYEFLRIIGLKMYPWLLTRGLEVFTPLEKGYLKPLTVSRTPFFLHRDIFPGRGKGRFGATLREYALGDLRFAQQHEYFKDRGYLNWDHTAGYLVPQAKYGAEHPEYYAQKWGKNLFQTTPTHKVPLCMCDPNVGQIAAQRALQWIKVQPERRYFAITNGDSKSWCTRCSFADPIPDYYTDQMLGWVNTVARSVAEERPDKRLFTLAYLNSVKPPLRTIPEPNVLVMYAPWYWNSKATSAAGFAHPLNITAMEEFMGWSFLVPEQVAIYDYPGSWVYGTAERIKFFAKNHVKWIYLNAPKGDFLHWVGSQLLWDPFLDVGELENEYLRVVYGSAAEVMGQYAQLRRRTITRGSQYTRTFFSKYDFVQQAVSLLDQATVIAKTADLDVQTRILAGAADGFHEILRYTHAGGMELGEIEQVFSRYVELQRLILKNVHKLGFHKGLIRNRVRLVEKKLSMLTRRKRPKTNPARNNPVEVETIFRWYTEAFEEKLIDLDEGRKLFPVSPPRSIGVQFEKTNEAGKWYTTASRTELTSRPQTVVLPRLAGGRLSGVQVNAQLSRFPVVNRGNVQVHAGKYHIEKTFDPPLDGRNLRFLDIHLYASRSVPVTVYLNKKGGVRSDINLFPGEQIIRVDLGNYRDTRFNIKGWDGKISSIAFDIWPQDIFFPYPKVQDTKIIFLGVQVNNHTRNPKTLPHNESAIWMTHYRASIPHGSHIIKEIAKSYSEQTGRRSDYNAIARYYTAGRVNERFRTFVEHRTVSPVVAILTSGLEYDETVRAANTMQKYLEQAFGVQLPVNPPGVAATPDTGNVIVIGRQAALETGEITARELARAGPEGFVIRARNGRIIIAGNNGAGTLFGVVRFLEDHGVRFQVPGLREYVPDNSSEFLHELYLVDWPYFNNRIARCGRILKTAPVGAPWKSREINQKEDLKAAQDLATAIKDLARRGETFIPQEIITNAGKSPLSCYISAMLMWDPFANTSWLVQEFHKSGKI